MSIRFPRLGATLLAAILAASLWGGPVQGSTPDRKVESMPKIKQLQREVMLRRAKARIHRAQEMAKLKKQRKPIPASRGRVARIEELGPEELQARQAAMRRRVTDYRAQAALAPNVIANDRGSDVITCEPGSVLCSTQAEESIAAWRQYVLVAWNDGERASLAAPNNDVQGYSFSADSGATFSDGGVPPKGTNWTWVSDPIVTVNEKTGTFYFCALVDSTPFFNGIGIVPATFSGSSITWGTPRMIRKVSSGQLALDKPWAVADSSSDSLYVSYTTFTVFGYDHIQFQRSPNGVNWTAATTISSGPDSGFVQGSRPVVGPNGEVYVVWSAIGPIDVDFFRIRKSTSQGATFGPETTIPPAQAGQATGFFGNWGTGAPGFNRERGITFPAIAVDRSTGPNRGRVYVTWNESINFYNDYDNGGPGANSEPPGESGANNTPATARAFTVNNRLRGAIGAPGDVDFWSFTATAGQTGVFFLDSLSAGLDVSFRLSCSDQVTQLGYSNFGVGGGGLIVFTFPANGTYYLRCAGFDNTTGSYKINTKFNVTGTERASDHRDVFVTAANAGVAPWSTPVRVHVNDVGRFDNWLPEVAVSGQGRAFVAWYDWRDDTNCGGRSHVYLARSDDGGASWVQLGSVTDVQSNWSGSASYLAPNQGDYIALYANENGVYPSWADVRHGDPDVFVSYLPLLVTPVQGSLLSAEATPRRVTLTWHAAGGAGLAARVYRRTESSDWAAIAEVAVPDNERVVYLDDSVAPGGRYAYRIAVLEGGVETPFGDTWVNVPLAVLEIAAVAPNPAARELWVSFSLPDAAPATLRLLDVAGRTVRTREVPAAAGPHRVNLSEGELLPMGVYVVKLTQGGSSVSTRVSVVR